MLRCRQGSWRSKNTGIESGVVVSGTKIFGFWIFFRYLFEFLAKRVFSGGKWIAELEGRFRGASAETLAGAHVIGTFAIFSWWFSCRKGATGRLKTEPYFSWVSIDAASAKYRNTRYLLFWRK